jgi:hypothetical protein
MEGNDVLLKLCACKEGSLEPVIRLEIAGPEGTERCRLG